VGGPRAEIRAALQILNIETSIFGNDTAANGFNRSSFDPVSDMSNARA
jgi:hypothetical protein